MMSSNELIDLKEGERLDDLHIKGYKIIQNTKSFCFGIDAVLLSDYSKVLPKETVVEFGTGTGIVSILLEAKTKGKKFIGVEIQEEVVDMARRSILYNNLQDKIEVIKGDIKDISKLIKKSSIDVIVSNPPYMNNKSGLISKDESIAISRHEILCNLEDVIREASKILKQRGRFYMIHRPFRLSEIFCLLEKYKLEAKRIRLVHPFVNKEPTMVLIESIKGANKMLKVDPPLIIYEDKGKYSKEVMDIYGY